MAGCVTWPRRSSASCPLTQKRTSSPSPSTRMSLRSGKWAAPRPLTSTAWVEPLPSVATFGSVRAHVGKGKVVGFMDEFGGPGGRCSRKNDCCTLVRLVSDYGAVTSYPIHSFVFFIHPFVHCIPTHCYSVHCVSSAREPLPRWLLMIIQLWKALYPATWRLLW